MVRNTHLGGVFVIWCAVKAGLSPIAGRPSTEI